MVEISIALTTHNREEDCIFCLTKLLEQKTNLIEIILLNDYHIDSENLKNFCNTHNIRYIHTGIQKKGEYLWRVPGFALNIGAKESIGNYLIIGNAEILHLDNMCIEKMFNNKKSISTPTVYAQLEKNNFKNLRTYKNYLPFFWGFPKQTFLDIGGYDEDFTGIAFEDNDISDRLRSVLNFNVIDSKIVHLWNTPPGAGPRWQHNKNIYESRQGILIRNTNKEWGIL